MTVQMATRLTLRTFKHKKRKVTIYEMLTQNQNGIIPTFQGKNMNSVTTDLPALSLGAKF